MHVFQHFFGLFHEIMFHWISVSVRPNPWIRIRIRPNPVDSVKIRIRPNPRFSSPNPNPESAKSKSEPFEFRAIYRACLVSSWPKVYKSVPSSSIKCALQCSLALFSAFWQSSSSMMEVHQFIEEYANSQTQYATLWFWKKMSSSMKPVERAAANLAEYYLTPPATSVDVERLFSTAGDILSNERNKLKPENASKILFLCL